jgi:N utilization substance protein B
MSAPHASIMRRRTTRLAAVQALYQMDIGGISVDAALEDAVSGRLPAGEDGPIDSDVDADLFRLLVDGVVAQQGAIDTMIAKHLASGWKLERIDAVTRAILRAGVVEAWRRKDTPVPVLIDEYVEIAKAFFDGVEPKFVHATLDACAKSVRAGMA